MDPNRKYTHYKKVDKQLLRGIAIEKFSTCPFKQNNWRYIAAEEIHEESKPPVMLTPNISVRYWTCQTQY